MKQMKKQHGSLFQIIKLLKIKIMKITEPYNYTIKEMKQIIVEWEAMGQIIDDYKVSEGIEDLAEEEFIYLFGESTLYPNIYFADPYECYDYRFASDYEWYLLKNGFNPFTGEIFSETEWPIYHIIEGIDTINPDDVSQEFHFCNSQLTFEEVIKEATIMDRFHLIIDDNHNIIGSGFFDAGDDINEYFRIKGLNEDFEFMKVEEPDTIDEGEWEFLVAQDLEYYSSLKSKDVDVYVSDILEVIELLNKPMDETAFRLLVHWNDGENQFLIMVNDYEQYCFYKVGLEKETSNIDRAIYLGSSMYSMFVLDIIQYFQNTGKALGYCDGSTEVEFLKGTDITNNQILSKGRIDHISDLAIQRYYAGKINLDIEQALIVMLSITHFLKFEMDHQKALYDKHNDRMVKELEDFKKAEGITNWRGEMGWIHKNGALQYNICIQDLLLQTLYKLNGSYYRTNDRDYDWEEKFDKIFVDMPFGREFDRAMIKFLLLPLYNSTHNTNYILESDYLKK